MRSKHPPPAPTYVQVPQSVAKKVNGLGIAGFVVSLLSLYFGAYFCIASVIGLVLSAVGLGLYKRFNSCNGLAIAGLVISAVSLVFWAFIWILGASIIAGLMSMV